MSQHRRRGRSAQHGRAASRVELLRARRRARARRRIAVLAGSVGLTAVVGVAAVAVAPNLRSAAEASTVDSALSSAQLGLIEAPAVTAASTAEVESEIEAEPQVPAQSGEGRRIVFDQSDQRVWLVDGDGRAERTYLVSGSIHDNLQPGSYRVQLKQRHAVAFDYSGTMEHFVQFTRGQNAAIGFHAVPKDNRGQLKQTKDELGTPLSAGCVRQWPDDAIALWDFAAVGTPVIVIA